MLDFGTRVQYSVFEAELDQKLFENLIRKIKNIIDEQKDSIRIYQLCASCKKEINILGQGTLIEEVDVYNIF